MKRLGGIVLFLFSGAVILAQDGVKSSASVPGSEYSPITPGERFDWVLGSTLGARNLASGVFTSAWGTWHNSPREYGTHWDGFGKRYGIRLADGSVSHTMEAGLGSLWGEDPRYFRAGSGQPFKTRIGHVIKMTFMATGRDGDAMPAYARYMGIVGTDFLANTWKPDSHATTNHALLRIPVSFADRLIGRAFSEFWPDARQHLFKKKRDTQ